MAQAVTAPAVRARKGSGEPLVMVTAYDAPGARIADEAGVDMILVGDSLAMVVLGYDDTLQVTVDDMAHHTAAVARAKPGPMVIADLPWLSYHLSVEDTVRNAARLIRAGAQAVKLEGGRKRLPMIEAIIDAEIPVMGHLGLTPQSVHAMGGFKVQGKHVDAAIGLVDDARALADGRVLRHRARGRARHGGPAGHRGGPGADHRHRRRPVVRRPGAGVPRPARPRGPGPAQVRAPLRLPQGRRGRPPWRPTRPTSGAGASPPTQESYHLAERRLAAADERRGRGRRPLRQHGVARRERTPGAPAPACRCAGDSGARPAGDSSAILDDLRILDDHRP